MTLNRRRVPMRLPYLDRTPHPCVPFSNDTHAFPRLARHEPNGRPITEGAAFWADRLRLMVRFNPNGYPMGTSQSAPVPR